MEYKLIKEYPNSPKIGTVIKMRPGTNMYFWNGLQICYPNNFPEFWQKIEELCVPTGTIFYHVSDAKKRNHYTVTKISDNLVSINSCYGTSRYTVEEANEYFKKGIWIVKEKEKTFEILAFKWSDCNKLHTLRDNKLYVFEGIEDNNVEYNYYNLNYMLSLKSGVLKFNIHSVKRLPDGEIFNVGDKTNAGIIESFSIAKDDETRILISFKEGIHKKWLDPKGSSIRKVLFTTTDGVDKFKGDSYIYITELFGETKKHFGVVDWDNPIKPLGKVQFHLDIRADNWIIENTKCISLADLSFEWEKYQKEDTTGASFVYTFINRVRSKIKFVE